MKSILLISLCLLSAGTLRAQNQGIGKNFTVRGEITGLAVGDTLRFERIELPELEIVPAFDVVVSNPDGFEHTEWQPRPEYYLMRYLPCTGHVPRTTKSGLPLIIDGGTISVTGTADWIYFSRVEGEAFGEQPLLREARDIQNSIERERSELLQSAQTAFAAGDSAQGSEYEKQFSQFQRREDSKRAKALENEFLRQSPSSPWSLVHYLQRASHTPIDTLEGYYARLDNQTQSSYFGTLLRRKIDHLQRLLPGKPAPDFRIELPDGTVMNSEAFRGKYLLIYHWGVCPGSIQVEKMASEFYNRFSDYIEVLGITESLAAIREAAVNTLPDAEMFGINLKKTFQSMAVHPWIDTEETGMNKKIGETFAFGGYPFFVLISPEGAIVSRGFHETLYDAIRVLNEQYEPKL